MQLSAKLRSICGVASCLPLCVVALLLSPSQTAAQLNTDPAPPAMASPSIFQQVRFDQRLGQQVPLDLRFSDEHGRNVTLGEFFGHGPVILTLAYYRCPMLCTQVLNGLVRSLRILPLELGKDYQAITVSIDPGDTTALAGSKHEQYEVVYGRAGAEHGWHFLTGKEPEIQVLAQAVGFDYAYDPGSQQFAHASGIIMLTPEGVVSQYSYGVSFRERDLRLGLVQASSNRIGSVIDQVLLYCYRYDPHTGRYGLLISRTLTISGVLTVGALGLMLFVLFRKENYALPKGAVK